MNRTKLLVLGGVVFAALMMSSMPVNAATDYDIHTLAQGTVQDSTGKIAEKLRDEKDSLTQLYPSQIPPLDTVNSAKDGIFSQGQYFVATAEGRAAPANKTMGLELHAVGVIDPQTLSSENLTTTASASTRIDDVLHVSSHDTLANLTGWVLVTLDKPVIDGNLSVSPLNNGSMTYSDLLDVSIVENNVRIWNSESSRGNCFCVSNYDDVETGSNQFLARLGSDTPFSFVAKAAVFATQYGGSTGSYFSAEATYPATFSWGGIQSVTNVDGSPLSDWSLTSDTGIDWSTPSASDLPDGPAPLQWASGAGLLALVSRARRLSAW